MPWVKAGTTQFSCLPLNYVGFLSLVGFLQYVPRFGAFPMCIDGTWRWKGGSALEIQIRRIGSPRGRKSVDVKREKGKKQNEENLGGWEVPN